MYTAHIYTVYELSIWYEHMYCVLCVMYSTVVKICTLRGIAFDLMADVCATWCACQQRLLLRMGLPLHCRPTYTYFIMQK